jgi:protein-S-isoprenylcysteine O-methyltransferase Ste14
MQVMLLVASNGDAVCKQAVGCGCAKRAGRAHAAVTPGLQETSMKPTHTTSSTFAPIVGFLTAFLTVRLAVPLALYALTLWVAWLGFSVRWPPDFARLMGTAFEGPAAPFKQWRLLAAAACIAIGGVLVVRGYLAQSRQGSGGVLTTQGIYRWLRHPQYTGCILIMLGVFAVWPELINALLLFGFGGLYVVWSIAEDRALAQAYGQAWLQYAQRTPAFVPGLFSRGRRA